MILESDYKDQELRNILKEILLNLKRFDSKMEFYSFPLTYHISDNILINYINKINYIFYNINNMNIFIHIEDLGHGVTRVRILTRDYAEKTQRLLSGYLISNSLKQYVL